MDRRRFLQTMTGVGLATAGLPLALACRTGDDRSTSAPSPTRVFRIGYVVPGMAGEPPPQFAATVEALARLDYREGERVRFEYRPGVPARFPEIAAELASLPVDLIVTTGEAATQGTMRATKTVPIVMAYIVDPVESGLVASLARPGGNVTGVAVGLSALNAKRLDLLQAAVPGLRRLAVLGDPAVPGSQRLFEAAQRAATEAGMAVHVVETRSGPGSPLTADMIVQAFEEIGRAQADGLLVIPSAGVNRFAAVVTDLSAKARVPAMYEDAWWAAQGGLLAYGPNESDRLQRLASLIVRVLEGAKPADTPVEQPTRFDFVINRTTAQTMGFAVPPSLLAQATQVIG